ncbi:MAG TPA: 4'-phosphopantetheinyl transferase superfamily protein [Wenzhouxiangella sp.]
MSVVTERVEGFPLPPLTPPTPGRVDVWLMDVAGLPMMVTPPERENGAASPLAHAARDLRIRQQFFLRLLFGRYLNKPGKDIRFSKTPDGKPFLLNENLEINITHTRGWLAVAVAGHGPIGIDIEIDRIIGRAGAMARRCYAPQEASAIEALDEPERSRAFLQRWIRTEALVKAQGARLATSLSHLEFDHPSLCLQTTPADWPSPEQWTIEPLPMPTPLIGAVASPEAIEGICLHRVVTDHS